MKGPPGKKLKQDLYLIIFESDTSAGKTFDVLLIISILSSVAVVMLDSLETVRERFGSLLYFLEWMFTLIFTLEYGFRLYCSRERRSYALSFFGLVDFLAILPTYISLFVAPSRYLVVIRLLRVLRIFRVLKLAAYIGEAHLLTRALIASRRKIIVFLFTVGVLVVIFGSLMYVIEGRENGFTSIPRSIYWAIVTMTTVGYGDISPKTSLGQTVSAVVMIIGYGIIAVPTGIVTSEFTQLSLKKRDKSRVCPACGYSENPAAAGFCAHCGGSMRRASEADCKERKLLP